MMILKFDPAISQMVMIMIMEAATAKRATNATSQRLTPESSYESMGDNSSSVRFIVSCRCSQGLRNKLNGWHAGQVFQQTTF